jgi:cold shock protein
MSSDKPRMKGTVKGFNASKGYGYITPDPDSGGLGIDELFAHQTAIQMDGFRTLDEGARVTFEVGQGPKGLQATDIRLDTDIAESP